MSYAVTDAVEDDMRELQKEVRDLHSTMISSIRHVMSRLQSLEYSPHSTRYAVLRFGPLRLPPGRVWPPRCTVIGRVCGVPFSVLRCIQQRLRAHQASKRMIAGQTCRRSFRTLAGRLRHG